ncbi:hypothetical protein CR513_43592, partial [Mucuna pruriens]
MKQSTLTVLATMIKLTSSNYSIWKSKIEDIFYCRDLEETQTKFDVNWTLMNKINQEYLSSGSTSNNCVHVMDKTRLLVRQLRRCLNCGFIDQLSFIKCSNIEHSKR